MKLSNSRLAIALLAVLSSTTNAASISPALSYWGQNGFFSPPVEGASKSGNVLELKNGETLTVSTVTLQTGSQFSTVLQLSKVDRYGVLDPTWQNGGIRRLHDVQGVPTNLSYRVQVSVIKTSYGFMAVEPATAGVPGVWLHAVDNLGNDTPVFSGFPYKFVPLLGTDMASFVDSFRVVDDPTRGRILALANYGMSSGETLRFLAAISYSGVAQSNFGTNGFVLPTANQNFWSSWRDVAVHDSIAVAGDVRVSENSETDFAVWKYDLNTGAPITYFGTGGYARLERAGTEWEARAEFMSGNLYLLGGRAPANPHDNAVMGAGGGISLYQQMTITRVAPNGKPDNTFGNQGFVDFVNPEHLLVVDTDRFRWNRFKVPGDIVFAAVGGQSGTPGFIGTVSLGWNSASVSYVPHLQCGVAGSDWPTRISVGSDTSNLSNDVSVPAYVSGFNQCDPNTPMTTPYVSKHQIQE